MKPKYTPVSPEVRAQRIADILDWLNSDRVLTESERAEYQQHLDAYAANRDPDLFGVRNA